MAIATIAFFPVGNGDMTLITTESDLKLLVDLNIRSAADDPDDDTPDVASELRKRLSRDELGRLYVDVLVLSHPDKDHCTGLREHFHLGTPTTWSKAADKILVREIWSSPMVFRRATKKNVLCDDAKAFSREARRRVRLFREEWGSQGDGDRVRILGEDEDGKTDGLESITVRVDEEFRLRSDVRDRARLLAPLPKSDADGEEVLSKNNSSTILRFSLVGGGAADKCRFLTGGDAEVAIWERLWRRHQWNTEWLSYDLLQAPHHCSWHSLSYDSWSEKGEDAEVCEDARSALSGVRSGGTIVASSNAIEDDGNDPPCIRAKREYEAIVSDVSGSFECVGEPEEAPTVLEFRMTAAGHYRRAASFGPAVVAPGVVGRQPLPHG